MNANCPLLSKLELYYYDAGMSPVASRFKGVFSSRDPLSMIQTETAIVRPPWANYSSGQIRPSDEKPSTDEFLRSCL